MSPHTPKSGKDFWGPAVWQTIHSFAAAYKPSPSTFKAFKDMIWAFTELLPCDFCRANLVKKLNAHPPDPYLNSNDDLFLWTYLIHDMVNVHISKYHPETPKNSPCYDDVKSLYFNALGKECSDCKI